MGRQCPVSAHYHRTARPNCAQLFYAARMARGLPAAAANAVLLEPHLPPEGPPCCHTTTARNPRHGESPCPRGKDDSTQKHRKVTLMIAEIHSLSDRLLAARRRCSATTWPNNAATCGLPPRRRGAGMEATILLSPRRANSPPSSAGRLQSTRHRPAVAREATNRSNRCVGVCRRARTRL